MPYLDHHAATPLCAEARSATAAALAAQANPSSIHRSGRAARALIEGARHAVAAAIGAAAADVVLTSGGTEACNLALSAARGDVVVGAFEHPAVVRAAERITRATGSRSIPLRPATLLDDLSRALTAGARFVAVQWVSHETGWVLPIERIASACRDAGALLFVDAIQALGKLPIDVSALPIDLLAISSAKIGGPLGAGALYVRRGVEVDPLLVGSQDERGRRAGSPALLPMVGFAAALGALPTRLEAQASIAIRRDALERALVELGAVINHDASQPRVATVTNVSLAGWRGTLLVAALDVEGLEASSGAACSSGLDAPSPVLRATFPDEPWRAESALRLSLGPETTDADVDAARAILARVLRR
jgi:cysteine desulfurase